MTPDLLQPTLRPEDRATIDVSAVVHSLTARFAHTGTGTVRMCFPLPIRRAITHWMQAASDEPRQNRPIASASQAVWWFSEQGPGLSDRQPVA